MSNVKCRKRLVAMEAGERKSVSRTGGAAVIYATFPPSTSDRRAGTAELHRTATAVGHATVGKLINQEVSLVVAARPSAGRSPAAARAASVERRASAKLGWVRAHCGL
jgi:hypothetical protein